MEGRERSESQRSDGQKIGPDARLRFQLELNSHLSVHSLRFHSFEPGVEVVEDVAGCGVEDAADEDVGHGADVVRILADEFADAELAAVPGLGQLADPRGAAGEIGHPFAELCAGRVILSASLR